MRILIVGGGTGGHVMPGLAIAREMRERYGAEVRFVGTARGLESRLVPESGFGLDLIRVGQLKNVSALTRIRTLGDLPLGVARCMGIIRSFQPAVVVGVGGYVSGPGMLAAIALRVPTLAYEPNAVPGLVNRRIGRWVSAAAVSYPATLGFFRNGTVTGVPVRDSIFQIAPKAAGLPPRLLVTAGSQGARIFNELMPVILPGLLAEVPGLTVMHQAGPRQQEETLARYVATGADPARWQVLPFLEDMPAQLAVADLVLARSGSTVAELAAAGRASVLVPLPSAADDHQRKNAEVLAGVGGAVMLLQPALTAAGLHAALGALLNDPSRLRAMGVQARTLARPGALEEIGRTIRELASRPSG